MTKIKLLEIEPVGLTRRFQSQLFVGRGVADFVMENGQMKIMVHHGYVPFHHEYEIIKDRSQMQIQEL
ncbi:hypothetical protein KMW28_27035 [Flammeovirga yaeyamensis]|uniref:Uncharacterized protein n=1 Tax=Flammeovirga yaeyamensis TaxID=367791 RepID=A0AAX1NAS7_9BACT|nr:hypothetical protein [Flammeovirga yaeyamensis]MBB3700067.1 G:T-mismatch repair DNA endonuclease (very short patch repair protein) [Flammeovirga yaeyamensis]NMF37498.1 hypothetical protein [Flammeovirga yaeyamensis]QWG04555.1 hypothetical protein KMW28_27035 [Flammeovirga yaeyamensis]